MAVSHRCRLVCQNEVKARHSGECAYDLRSSITATSPSKPTPPQSIHGVLFDPEELGKASAVNFVVSGTIASFETFTSEAASVTFTRLFRAC